MGANQSQDESEEGTDKRGEQHPPGDPDEWVVLGKQDPDPREQGLRHRRASQDNMAANMSEQEQSRNTEEIDTPLPVSPETVGEQNASPCTTTENQCSDVIDVISDVKNDSIGELLHLKSDEAKEADHIKCDPAQDTTTMDNSDVSHPNSKDDDADEDTIFKSQLDNDGACKENVSLVGKSSTKEDMASIRSENALSANSSLFEHNSDSDQDSAAMDTNTNVGETSNCQSQNSAELDAMPDKEEGSKMECHEVSANESLPEKSLVNETVDQDSDSEQGPSATDASANSEEYLGCDSQNSADADFTPAEEVAATMESKLECQQASLNESSREKSLVGETMNQNSEPHSSTMDTHANSETNLTPKMSSDATPLEEGEAILESRLDCHESNLNKCAHERSLASKNLDQNDLSAANELQPKTIGVADTILSELQPNVIQTEMSVDTCVSDSVDRLNNNINNDDQVLKSCPPTNDECAKISEISIMAKQNESVEEKTAPGDTLHDDSSNSTPSQYEDIGESMTMEAGSKKIDGISDNVINSEVQTNTIMLCSVETNVDSDEKQDLDESARTTDALHNDSSKDLSGDIMMSNDHPLHIPDNKAVNQDMHPLEEASYANSSVGQVSVDSSSMVSSETYTEKEPPECDVRTDKSDQEGQNALTGPGSRAKDQVWEENATYKENISAECPYCEAEVKAQAANQSEAKMGDLDKFVTQATVRLGTPCERHASSQSRPVSWQGSLSNSGEAQGVPTGVSVKRSSSIRVIGRSTSREETQKSEIPLEATGRLGVNANAPKADNTGATSNTRDTGISERNNIETNTEDKITDNGDIMNFHVKSNISGHSNVSKEDTDKLSPKIHINTNLVLDKNDTKATPTKDTFSVDDFDDLVTFDDLEDSSDESAVDESAGESISSEESSTTKGQILFTSQNKSSQETNSALIKEDDIVKTDGAIAPVDNITNSGDNTDGVQEMVQMGIGKVDSFDGQNPSKRKKSHERQEILHSQPVKETSPVDNGSAWDNKRPASSNVDVGLVGSDVSAISKNGGLKADKTKIDTDKDTKFKDSKLSDKYQIATVAQDNKFAQHNSEDTKTTSTSSARSTQIQSDSNASESTIKQMGFSKDTKDKITKTSPPLSDNTERIKEYDKQLKQAEEKAKVTNIVRNENTDISVSSDIISSKRDSKKVKPVEQAQGTKKTEESKEPVLLRDKSRQQTLKRQPTTVREALVVDTKDAVAALSDGLREMGGILKEETVKRERAEDWSDFLSDELLAHIKARTQAEASVFSLRRQNTTLSDDLKQLKQDYQALVSEIEGITGEAFIGTNRQHKIVKSGATVRRAFSDKTPRSQMLSRSKHKSSLQDKSKSPGSSAQRKNLTRNRYSSAEMDLDELFPDTSLSVKDPAIGQQFSDLQQAQHTWEGEYQEGKRRNKPQIEVQLGVKRTSISNIDMKSPIHSSTPKQQSNSPGPSQSLGGVPRPDGNRSPGGSLLVWEESSEKDGKEYGDLNASEAVVAGKINVQMFRNKWEQKLSSIPFEHGHASLTSPTSPVPKLKSPILANVSLSTQKTPPVPSPTNSPMEPVSGDTIIIQKVQQTTSAAPPLKRSSSKKLNTSSRAQSVESIAATSTKPEVLHTDKNDNITHADNVPDKVDDGVQSESIGNAKRTLFMWEKKFADSSSQKGESKLDLSDSACSEASLDQSSARSSGLSASMLNVSTTTSDDSGHIEEFQRSTNFSKLKNRWQSGALSGESYA